MEERKPRCRAPPEPALQSRAPGLSSSPSCLPPPASGRHGTQAPSSCLHCPLLGLRFFQREVGAVAARRTGTCCPQVTPPTGPWDAPPGVPSSPSHPSPPPMPLDAMRECSRIFRRSRISTEDIHGSQSSPSPHQLLHSRVPEFTKSQGTEHGNPGWQPSWLQDAGSESERTSWPFTATSRVQGQAHGDLQPGHLTPPPTVLSSESRKGLGRPGGWPRARRRPVQGEHQSVLTLEAPIPPLSPFWA